MIRSLSLAETLDLHGFVIERWGGASQIRDIGALESAIAQPRQSFGGEDLYPDLTRSQVLGSDLVLCIPWIAYSAMHS